jgi:hypothetical protein
MTPISRYYRSCDPDASLKPGDPRYIDLTLARGERGGGWRKRLARDLRQTDRASVFLVSGFLGDGKSTQLLRLQEDLKSGDPKLAVVYVDCSKFLNEFEYTFNEFLLGVISEAGQRLRKGYGIELRRTYLSRKLDEITASLGSDVELREVSAGVKVDAFELAAKIALRARDSDRVRRQLADALSGDRTTLNQEFADSINDTARPALQKLGYRDLVIIVDWLEKLVDLPVSATRPVSGHQALFLHHSHLIRAWGAQVVMTVPIDMVYSSRQANLQQAYGCEPIVINQVGVADFLDAGQRLTADAAFRDLLRARAGHAPDGLVDYGQVFDPPELDLELIRFSGGHLRTLMMLVRLCCSFTDQLPITAEVWNDALRDHLLNVDRKIKEPWLALLAMVHRTHRIVNDPDHFDMLQALAVLAYANGTVPVYGVEPAIQQLPKFQAALKGT